MGDGSKLRRLREIKRELPTLSAHLDAAEHRRLTLIRELDELDVSLGEGLTTARWLAWRIGLSPGAAREKVRIARALGKLPQIDAAFQRGELSYSKIRAVTRVATPETEDAILHQARIATAAQLEKICRGVRRVQRRREEKGKSREGDRWVLWRETDDGMVVIKAKMEPDEAAAFIKAIEAAQQRAFEREKAEARARSGSGGVSAETSEDVGVSAGASGGVGVSAETSGEGPASAGTRGNGSVSAETPAGRPRWPNRVDALLEIAEAYVANDAPPASRAAAERRQIVIALTPSALIDEAYQVTLDDGTRVSAEAFRRLACDAGLVPAVVDEDGRPLDVGRKTRSIPKPIMRALVLRDGGCCQFPGCLNKLGLEGHHRQSWLDGGETKLDNLVLLCPHHHRLVHEGGFTIEATAAGTFVFRDRQGRVLERSPQPTPLGLDAPDRLMQSHAEAGIRIDDQTGLCSWDGTRPDYSYCIDVITSRDPTCRATPVRRTA